MEKICIQKCSVRWCDDKKLAQLRGTRYEHGRRDYQDRKVHSLPRAGRKAHGFPSPGSLSSRRNLNIPWRARNLRVSDYSLSQLGNATLNDNRAEAERWVPG